MYTIYKITNRANGKIYFGRTLKTPSKRLAAHFKAAFTDESPLRFHRAIRKHGKECFSVEHLAEASSKEKANWLEKMYISEYNSMDFQVGYNSTRGGDGGGMLGKNHSENTRSRMSRSHLGKRFTEEHKRKLSINNGRPMQGKTMLEDTKLKIGHSLKKKWKEDPAFIERMTRRPKQDWVPHKIPATLYPTIIAERDNGSSVSELAAKYGLGASRIYQIVTSNSTYRKSPVLEPRCVAI